MYEVPSNVDIDSLSWDELEDYWYTCKEMRVLVSAKMMKSGKRFDNFLFERENIYGDLCGKYDGNMWTAYAAWKRGEDIFAGIDI